MSVLGSKAGQFGAVVESISKQDTVGHKPYAVDTVADGVR